MLVLMEIECRNTGYVACTLACFRLIGLMLSAVILAILPALMEFDCRNTGYLACTLA